MGEWIALNKQDGLFLGTADSSKNIQTHLFFKFPASDGEIYEYQIPMTDSTLTMEVLKEKISACATEFECYGYIYHNLHSYFPMMHFSENIGLIQHKLIYMGRDTSNVQVWKLDSYDLVAE